MMSGLVLRQSYVVITYVCSELFGLPPTYKKDAILQFYLLIVSLETEAHGSNGYFKAVLNTTCSLCSC